MSRPRFLADHDFNQHIIQGLRRREPTLEIVRLQDVGMHDRPDADVLQYAADHGFLVLSHDVNTMPAAVNDRRARNLPLPGLLLARQRDPIRPIIDDLVLIWLNSDMEEWHGAAWFLPL